MTKEERRELNEFLQNKLNDERKKWTNLIEPIILKMDKDPEQLSSAQCYMLKYRHDLTEEISMLLNDLSKEYTQIKEMKKERLENYLSGRSQFRLQQKAERDIMIAGEIAQIEETVSILESHLEFLRECRNTLDKMAYSVSNRIEIYKLLLQ